VRQITRGPKYHWFAYYDKFQFDPTNRYALGMELEFEHRSPRPDDQLRLGMVDLADGDRWIDLGETTTAWCWQQGCMLQWLPGSPSEIIWNDRQDDRYVCRIMDVKTRAKRTVPHPIYAVSPDGRWAVAPDFARIGELRPGYGYNGIDDPHRDQLAPAESGIFHIDLKTGRQRLIVSLADVARLPFEGEDLAPAKHWFNHLLVNTDGSRFTFLHRWKQPGKTNWLTRMLTAAPDGSDLRVLIGSGYVSHFIWRDPDHMLAFSKTDPKGDWGFYLFQDVPGGTVEHIAPEIKHDGHCTYSPDRRWMLSDTYPDKQMDQHIYLYDVAERRRVDLGAFRLPKVYRECPPYYEWRCDLHPRFSRDGRSVVFDSPHTGQGRQMHLIDVSRIVGA